MNDQHRTIVAAAAPIPIANLDTDQIMPKQFLRGIDKSGLREGLFYDLRFHPDGKVKEGFVLNRPAYSKCSVLIAGPNFGCGSSREHAVWGLMQYGIKAVIAPSFGEIFYSNAMNNGLLAAMVPQGDAERLMTQALEAEKPLMMTIDVEKLVVQTVGFASGFHLSRRHQEMFLQGVDMLGATMLHLDEINTFATNWHSQRPWLKDVAARTRLRLERPR
jgi:3-isopropylmalate/(R)-2-methylmalate dehydratase small subunit